jgi:RNA polymerase sigma-70 factor, ECF subfamily
MADAAAIAAFREVTGAAAASPDVDRRVAEAIAAARAAHPDLDLPDADVSRFLAERYPGGDLLDYLDRIDPAELYLVCACLAGNPAALSRFDREYLTEVRTGASRLRPTPDELDDITQQVRAALLAPRDDQPPRLATMTARGDLKALIRLMALRTGISLRRKHHRELPTDTAILDLAGPDDSPSLVFARQQHRDLFSRALEQALDRLDPRTRSALKLHCLDGVPLAQLATMYNVDRSTITRWLARARTDILTHTRRTLAAEANIPTDHFDSFVDLLRSNFDLSLQRMLTND